MDGEPPNGDYVAYIDRLVNQGGTQPGGVAPGGRGRGFKSAWPGAARASGPSLPAPHGAGPAAARRPAASATAAQDATPAAPQTLASRHARGKAALLLQALAAVLAVIGLRMLQGAAHLGTGGIGDFVPGAFILFFAWMLFRAGSGVRRASRAPLPDLPAFTAGAGAANRKTSTTSRPSVRS